MKKIAIKYEEGNWANIKIAVDLIRSTGLNVVKRKDDVCFNDKASISKVRFLVFDEEECNFDKDELGFYYWYNLGSDSNEYVILSMPEDLDKLKEALGVDVVPEYIECIDVLVENTFLSNISKTIGHTESFYKISGDKFIPKVKCKPSTKEAYEAQEAKKNKQELGSITLFPVVDYDLFGVKRIKELEENSKKLDHGTLRVSDAFRKESSKLRVRLSKKSDRIKELKISNNELKVEIETKDKRISELEKNLIIMCELGNKVLG